LADTGAATQRTANTNEMKPVRNIGKTHPNRNPVGALKSSTFFTSTSGGGRGTLNKRLQTAARADRSVYSAKGNYSAHFAGLKVPG
jgi:hypothetical protein